MVSYFKPGLPRSIVIKELQLHPICQMCRQSGINPRNFSFSDLIRLSLSIL